MVKNVNRVKVLASVIHAVGMESVTGAVAPVIVLNARNNSFMRFGRKDQSSIG